MKTEDESNANRILSRAQPVLNQFYEAVRACHREPPFKPSIQIATFPGPISGPISSPISGPISGPIRYDHAEQAVVLVPYELLAPAAKAGMDRYAAIGTLGISGRAQYEEIFQGLLVAHELGHWLQCIAHRPLTRWQAEYGANQIMVAFWREHPAPPPAPPAEARLANFIVQPPHFPTLLPNEIDLPIETYFDQAIEEIETDPPRYAAFQKMMVRRAIAEDPHPRLCDLIHSTWPPA